MGPEICISDKLPGPVEVPGVRRVLGEPQSYTKLANVTYYFTAIPKISFAYISQYNLLTYSSKICPSHVFQ